MKTLSASRVRVMLNIIEDTRKWVREIEKSVEGAGQDLRIHWVKVNLAEIRSELLHVSLADVAVEETAP